MKGGREFKDINALEQEFARKAVKREVSVYYIKKKYIRKERIDFDRVYSDFDNLIRGIILSFPKIEDKPVISDWLDRNNCYILIPEPGEVYHVISIHISERKWYNTPERARQHFRAAYRKIMKLIKKLKIDAKTFTYICIGNYTNSVKGPGCRRIGITTRKNGYFFFRPDKPWLKIIAKSIYNMVKSRLYMLERRLAQAGVEAYGIVKELKNWLEEVIRLLPIHFDLR